MKSDACQSPSVTPARACMNFELEIDGEILTPAFAVYCAEFGSCTGASQLEPRVYW